MVRDILIVEVLSLAVAAVAMTVTAVVARRVGRVSVVDVTWGLALAAVAAVDAVGSAWPSWVLFGLVAAWGVRLSGHIARRSRGHGEDPRYVVMLGGSLREVGMAVAVRKVFLIQGLAVCLVSLPLQSLAVAGLGSVGLFWFGVGIAAVGMVIEAVGDAQLAAYKADLSRPAVLDRGLWAWTRHPNYFGDALFWIGIWVAGGLAAEGTWVPAAATVAAPIAMTLFLWFITGARLLETTMMERPGYRAYADRTPMFVPRPPTWGHRL
jgi:steroid 5-alpha reductase family enzyme